MSHLQASQVLAQVDELLPNQYDAAQKRFWLGQAERYVAQEILHVPAPEVMEDDTVLLAQPPYDELYRHYVEAQIHYANGEAARYGNAAALWNSLFLAYHDFCLRTGVPQQPAKALRLC